SKRNFRHHHLVGIHPITPTNRPTANAPSVDFEVATQTTGPRYANTALVDQGGPKIDFADVRVIFWGSAWPTDPNRSAIMNNIAAVIASPFATSLKQYGVNGVSLDSRGPLAITTDPPDKPFTDQTVSDFITGLIDNEILPEPDEDYRLVPVVLMPP